MIKVNRVLVSAVAIAAAMSLTACSTTKHDAYTGQKEVNATVGGTTVGALAGATIAGVATGGAGAVVGGGAVGGVVGHHWDKDEAAIRAQMRSAGVQVVEIGYSNDIVLVMPSDVRFATGSAQIKPHFAHMLGAVAEVLKQYKYTVADIIGNADGVGSAKYNMNLSLARAQSVADYLASQGVEANRLIPQGYGEMRPVASNASAKGRAENRNVQIVLFAPPIRK